MHDHIIQRKFLRDPDGGKDVVSAVGVKMGFDLPIQKRQQRLAFEIKFRPVKILVGLSPAKLFPIPCRAEKLFPDDCGRRHAGDRRGRLAVIGGFGILSQRELNRDRRGQKHIVDPPPIGRDGRNLPRNRIGAARPGQNGCYASLHRL